MVRGGTGNTGGGVGAAGGSTRSAPQVLNKQMGSMNSPGGMFGSAEPFPMPFDMVGL